MLSLFLKQENQTLMALQWQPIIKAPISITISPVAVFRFSLTVIISVIIAENAVIVFPAQQTVKTGCHYRTLKQTDLVLSEQKPHWRCFIYNQKELKNS